MLTILVLALSLMVCIGQAIALPMGTSFTYQGRLMDGESWADGLYEIEFKLFDLASGGTQVDDTYSLRSVEVSDGYFTVQLDFGSDAFDGDARWLEIGIRPANTTGAFTTLSPRQEVTPSPYALYAETANIASYAETAGSTGDGIGGGGAAGYVAKFTGPTTVGNSAIYDNSGSVGIGTTNPNSRLHIWKPSSSSPVFQLDTQKIIGELTVTKKLLFDGTSIDAEGVPLGDLPISLNPNSSGDVHLVGGGGKVGVGTTEPTQKLHVAGMIRSSSGGFMFPDNSVQTSAYWEGLGDSIRNTNIANVGIGVAIPTSKLTVGGNIFVSTADGRVITPILEIIGGSDLSEQFDVRPDEKGVEPCAGMVVSIDPENPGELVVSGEVYDRKVAGIISGAGGIKPGMLMGQKGTLANGANPVALTGRVYCLADARNGSIRPGDLLTTSERPGHAMKVTDHVRAQGAILGKAMTSLENGQGQVLVLVTLQ